MMIQKTTNRDTIIDEIHRTRQRMAEKFGYDVAAILEDALTCRLGFGPPWTDSTCRKECPAFSLQLRTLIKLQAVRQF
jgi:hypothetical protein